jgi:hypothetical protein
VQRFRINLKHKQGSQDFLDARVQIRSAQFNSGASISPSPKCVAASGDDESGRAVKSVLPGSEISGVFL